ncbi:MAG: hypothetical protein AAFU85_19265, partial [Planctomycetota bacterium]
SGDSSIFKHLDESPQAEQRRYRRVPRSVGIVVQPLDDSMQECDSSFLHRVVQWLNDDSHRSWDATIAALFGLRRFVEVLEDGTVTA